jgi:hypothetical protein
VAGGTVVTITGTNLVNTLAGAATRSQRLARPGGLRPAGNADGTHWVCCPYNAVKSHSLWRLTFQLATASIDNSVGMTGGLMSNVRANALALDPVKDVANVG